MSNYNYKLDMLLKPDMDIYHMERFQELLIQFSNGFEGPKIIEGETLKYPIQGETECTHYTYMLDIEKDEWQAIVNIETVCTLYGDCLRFLVSKA